MLDTRGGTVTDWSVAELPEGFTAQMAARFNDRFTRALPARVQHGGLEGHHPPAPPQAVVFAESDGEVAFVAALCHEHYVPLIAHGAGTSLEGHLAAVNGGLSLDLSRMNEILSVSPDNLLCTVQAGVTREQLNYALRADGLFFPLDPGANASLGGMAATRASGTNAVRYGTMRDNVLALTVILADGRIIRTGNQAAKSSAGYDLTGLFVGSEGTLGIITEVTLRLHGIPETTLAATCAFETLKGAVSTVIAAIQIGLPIARIELLDAAQVAACNAYSKLSLVVAPTLFLEFHGTEAAVAHQVATFKMLAECEGGKKIAVAERTEDRSRLWAARHSAYFAAKALRPNARVWTTDVCVPIARLTDSIVAAREEIEASGLTATIVGHVGDGNYHVMFVLDPGRGDEETRAAAINDEMVSRAIAIGGTCTGEHGVGLGKQRALIEECGADAIEVMRGIRAVLDPRGILNPGKIFAS